MQRRDFHYDLPEELIAQQPPAERAGGRMLVLSGNGLTLEDRQVRDLPGQLSAGDLLVLNDTRVIPARLLGQKATGGKVEVLVERVLEKRRVLAHVRASKPPRPGTWLRLADRLEVRVEGRDEDLFLLEFAGDTAIIELLERHGHVPLPPYITRADEVADRERYQTLFGQRPGAVAAPTAGLHFDPALLAAIGAAGVNIAYVTLHVGAGTFQPVRVDDLSQHHMHAEWLEVSPETVAAVNATRQKGGRIVAVGTTVVRSLESAAAGGELQPFAGDSRLFITPGYSFRVVDALLTNFHLPESTLLMLVSAFAGQDNIMRAYRHAVAQRYRFFSYGDAMFITRKQA